MDSLFPDREWWLVQFFAKDDDGGGGGDDADAEESDDDEGDDDQDGEPTPEDQIANLKEALRKSRGDLRKTRRELTAAKKGGSKTGAASGNRKAANEDGDDPRDALINDLRREVRTGRAKDEIRTLAIDAGAAKPDGIFRLVKSEIEWDDDGNADNLDDLVAEAKKDYPELFKKTRGPADLGGGGGGDKKSKGNKDWIRQLVDDD